MGLFVLGRAKFFPEKIKPPVCINTSQAYKLLTPASINLEGWGDQTRPERRAMTGPLIFLGQFSENPKNR